MSGDVSARAWGKAIGTDRKQFNMFFENMLDGFSYNKIVVDEAGAPIDYVFLEVNDAFERMTGLKREKVVGKRATEVFKGLENAVANWIAVYGKVALTCESIQFEDSPIHLASGSMFLLTAQKEGTSLPFLKI